MRFKNSLNSIRLFKRKKAGKHILSSKKSIVIILSLLPILYGLVRNGHENYSVSLAVLIVLADMISVIGNGRICFNSYGKELWFAVLLFCIELPLQMIMYGGEHFKIGNAAWNVIVIALMIVSIPILIRKKYGFVVWKFINVMGLVNSVLIIAQYALKLFGIRLDRLGVISDYLFKAWEFNSRLYRPCGMFSEPSHFAEVALLSLFSYLFLEKNYKKAAVVLVALALSTSSLGILGSIMIVILYVLGLDQYTNVKKGIKGIIVFFAFLIVIAGAWWASESTSIVAQRIFSGGTVSVRMFRSFELYAIQDPFSKIFGIGLQNQELYLNYHNIILPSDTYETIERHREFAQTFGYMLCTTGLLGLIGFWKTFWKMAWKNTWKVKSLIVLFLATCLVCCNLTRISFLLYLLAIYALIDIEKYKPIHKTDLQLSYLR